MDDTEEISAAFPFESKYIDVHGSKMDYIDEGEGDPILFLHGNPMSSYLWRNIVPHHSGQGRCIAPDLIGMGQSDHPDIACRYDDQYRYLSGFIENLGIGSNVTLVIHDWGSGLGFRWAHDHAARRHARKPPSPVSDDACPGHRVADGQRRELALDGKPADNFAVVEAYRQWLTETEVPKLLFHGNGGVAIKEPEVAWCRENLDIVDLGDGIHFLQETHPHTIGSELSTWYAGL